MLSIEQDLFQKINRRRHCPELLSHKIVGLQITLVKHSEYLCHSVLRKCQVVHKFTVKTIQI